MEVRSVVGLFSVRGDSTIGDLPAVLNIMSSMLTPMKVSLRVVPSDHFNM